MRIAVNGARGRMGRMVLEVAATQPDVEVVAVLERPDHPDAGRHVRTPGGDLILLVDPAAVDVPVDAAIDFSAPEAAVAFAREMAGRGIPVVSGTIGLRETHVAALREAARDAPVLWAPNTSIGVYCLHDLAARAREVLGGDYDVEIVEVHHRHKRDAPSGTALSLARRLDPAGGASVVSCREGESGPRPEGEIGVLSVRGGEVVGDHTVLFLGDHDRIEITHRAASRQVFASGAFALARRMVGRAPGFCTIEELMA